MKGFTIITATILSTVIHFFVLALLDTIPLVPKEVPPRPNIYMVDLVPLAMEQRAPQKEEEAAVQQKVEEVKKEEIKKKEVKKEEVKKEEVKEVKKKEEIKKEEVKKAAPKDDKTVLADRTKEREKKEDKKPPPLDAEQQLSASIKAIAQKVAERGAVTDSEMQVYVAMARERVKGFWVIPDTLSSEKDLKAVIIIEIDQRGHVKGSRFEQSSGNRSFDQSAMRAVSKAAPFPPPPGQVPLEIGLIFQPR
jgi:colicin import membrane protein